MKQRTRIEGFWQRMNAVMADKNKNELARRIGCNRKTLYGNDGTLSPVYLARFCAITGTDANWLLGIRKDKPVGWIPLTRRPMTAEEREYYKAELEYYDYAEIFNCPLPDDEQEVLITMNGWVSIDTFSRDSDGGCSFEGYDIDDIRAWMPLPEPYKTESEG